VRAGVRFNY